METAIRELAFENRVDGPLDAFRIRWAPHAIDRRVHPKLEQQIVGFERGIGGEISPPVSVFVLAAKQ